MIIQKCDICGRIEGLKMLAEDGETKYSLTFTSAPFKITLTNYRGEEYNAYIDIGIQKAADTNNLKMAYEKLKGAKNSIDSLFDCIEKPNGLQSMQIKVDNPYPSVCDECKQKLIEKIMKKEFTHDLF